MTKIVNDIAAQGDVTFVRVGELPKTLGLRPATADTEAKGFIIAHSETGHHHVARLNGGTEFLVPMSGLVAYLQSENEIEIDHLRDFDTHGSLKLAPGIWEVRRQREWSGDNEQIVAD
jgi:hypothetical protein